MKADLLLILFGLTLLFSSCKKDRAKPDGQYPELPAYSEKGLNVGGVMINGSAWPLTKLGIFSTARPLQLLSYPSGDSIVVLFNGAFRDTSLAYLNIHTAFVVLRNIRVVADEDLLQLNGKTYVLDGSTNYGGFSDISGASKVGRALGKIVFGKVSVIPNITYGDGSPGNPILHPYVVAGRFDMSFTTSSSFSLTEGRFDVTLVRSNSQFHVF